MAEPLRENNAQLDTQSQSGFNTVDTGLRCLVMIAGLHGVNVDAEQVKHFLAIGSEGMDAFDIVKAAKELGFKARLARVKFDRLSKLPLPAIIGFGQSGFAILAKIEDDRVLLFDPNENKPKPMDRSQFTAQWDENIILFVHKGIELNSSKFGLRWFIPSILKYKKMLIEVLLASLLLQLFGLCAPLITQVVIDKVLAHHGVTTLNVLASGLLAIALFELILGISRSYVFSHTTSRIDIMLGARLFRHLFRLPLAYFEARRVGDTVARIRELENIRQFITGTPMTSLLDVLFISVYIAVMFMYSTTLSFVVLGAFPFYIALSALFTPLLRQRLEDKFQKGAESQSYLVEAVSGIQTIKSFALEPLSQKKWEGLLAGYIKASFRTSTLSGMAGAIGQFIQKMSALIILWLGAHLVMSGTLSVGQLIAFQMLSSRVSDPILRLVQLWQDFQQTGLSIRKLGDIFHTKPEPSMDPSKARLPSIRGEVTFDKVTFRYRADGPEIIRGMSFQIRPGMIIGFVGRSGSGKSTISKLIQRLYIPESGKISIDGVDIALADPAWLRRQIGVVLQENFLFNGSVRDNIAIHHPSASMNEIIKVAKLAGAHEFILDLPEAYDTIVGEKGTMLSGGQRQRIAIARALLMNPKILIFDEATSALDYESERIIQDNLQHICRGRTVFIIAHRLSTLKHADRIMVIDKGILKEFGNHHELIERKGLYYHLHSQQERNG